MLWLLLHSRIQIVNSQSFVNCTPGTFMSFACGGGGAGITPGGACGCNSGPAYSTCAGCSSLIASCPPCSCIGGYASTVWGACACQCNQCPSGTTSTGGSGQCSSMSQTSTSTLSATGSLSPSMSGSPSPTPTPVFLFPGASTAGFSVVNPAGVSFVADQCGVPGAATSLSNGAYLTYSGSTAALPSGSAPKSSIVWLKCPAQSSVTAFDFGSGGCATHNRFASYIRSTQLYSFVGSGTGGDCDSIFVLCDGSWHHVAATFSGSSVSVYVDAGIIASCTVTAPFNIPASPTVFVGWNGVLSCNGGEIWSGAITNARIFNVALSPAAIAADKLKCVSPSQSATVSPSGTQTQSSTASVSRTPSVSPPSLTLCAYYMPVLGDIYNLLAYGTTLEAAHGNFILWAQSTSLFAATYTVSAPFATYYSAHAFSPVYWSRTCRDLQITGLLSQQRSTVTRRLFLFRQRTFLRSTLVLNLVLVNQRVTMCLE